MKKTNQIPTEAPSKIKFSAVGLDQVEIPVLVEKKTAGKDYILYGANNLFPQYLYSLYTRSALMQSIIGSTVDYIMGDAILTNPIIAAQEYWNDNDDTLRDVIKNICNDLCIFGGFAVEVLRDYTGKIVKLNPLDYCNVRTNEDRTIIYYNKDWRTKPRDFVEVEVFDPNKKQAQSIFYYRGHQLRGVYPYPSYLGAIPALETSCRISNFHLNNIKNGFFGSYVFNFNNGQPDPETQGIIERGIKNKFSGDDNAGAIMTIFNESKDNALTVEKLDAENLDERFDQLRQDTYKEIFTAFRISPQLIGYSLEGTAFNSQEFQNSFALYNKTVVSPLQKDLTRCFDKIFGIDNAITIEPFKINFDN